MMIRIRSLFIVLFCIALQVGEAQEVNWITWEEAQELMKAEPRKVIVDVYTDWCGWCKRMDQVTFQHPEIALYVNRHFYAVRKIHGGPFDGDMQKPGREDADQNARCDHQACG